MRFTELTSILQAAVSPVILISGVGLLMLSMTNRFGRVIDRSRQLRDLEHRSPAQDRKGLERQLEILATRAQLLRLAITFATFSVLMAAVLVITLFLTSLFRVEIVWLGALLFMACLTALITSLLVFLQDINLSLAALRLELGESGNPRI